MNPKLAAFVRETINKVREKMTLEERLEGLSPEERLKGMSAEEVVRALSPEALEALRRQLKANGSSTKPQ